MQVPSNPIVRAIAGVLLVAIGYCAVIRSVATALAKTDPIAASSLTLDARILGNAALFKLDRASDRKSRDKAVFQARRAIERDATVVSAAVAIGLAKGLNNDEKAGDTWLSYSDKLSRRDMRTQLYLIEKAVGKGDVTAALTHYDIALRTSETISSTLFPVLRAAVSSADVRSALARTLAQKPQWGTSFVADLAENGPDYDAAMLFFVEARRNGVSVDPSAEAALLNNLTRRGKIAAAWQYYVATHPDATSKLVRNAGFNPDISGSSPFDWQFTSGDGVTASLSGSVNAGMLEYSLAPTVGSTVAQQTIILPPGNYRLESTIISSSQPLGSGPYWTVQCIDGSILGKLEMGASAASVSHFATTIVVPTNCPTQVLNITVRSSDDVQGATGQIASVSIKRLN